jgi:hypothetical protein
MNGVLDHSLVGLALLVSAGYAVLSLGPRTFRRRMFGVLNRLAARAPAWLRLGWAARRLAMISDGDAKGSCGGCGTCESEAAEPENPGGGPKSPVPEIRVPVAKVGRRG